MIRLPKNSLIGPRNNAPTPNPSTYKLTPATAVTLDTPNSASNDEYVEACILLVAVTHTLAVQITNKIHHFFLTDHA